LGVGGAVSGLTRPDVALTRSGLGSPSDNLRRSSVPAFPRGTPPSGQLESITAGEGELIAFQASNKVPSRSMACMMTARRRASATRAFLRPRRFAIFSAQVFSREGLPRARQDRVCRLVEELAYRAVALLGDPARPVELARLVSTRDEAEVRTCCSRPLEPARLIDGGGERGRGLHADARDAHQCLTSRRDGADRLELAIHPADLVDQPGPRPEQRG
jgi:hypothetical protein